MGSEDHDRERVRDIIKRLLNRAVNAEIIKEKPNLYYDAAHQIEQLYDENETLRRDVKTAVMGDSAELQDVKRENEKLRAALKPFADAVKDECNWKYDINVDDFRAAAAAIRESGE